MKYRSRPHARSQPAEYGRPAGHVSRNPRARAEKAIDTMKQGTGYVCPFRFRNGKCDAAAEVDHRRVVVLLLQLTAIAVETEEVP